MRFTIVDFVVVLFILSSLARGYRIGLVRQAGSTIGFVVGLFTGSYISNLVVGHFHSTLSKPLVSLLVVLGTSLIFMTIGEIAGIRAKQHLTNESVNKIDGGLGSIMSIVTTLFGVWLIGAILVLMPASGFQQAIKGSQIIARLNRILPPATQLLGNLNKLIDPNGFPQVFSGLEPSPKSATQLPSLGSFNTVIAQTQPSVVKVEGAGCGGIVEGSGWVATTNEIVTNAHVVAGVTSPKVQDSNGTHNARVIWFDKDIDLAVLRVGDLAGKPLSLNVSSQAADTASVVLGYPGGGDFNAQPASVIDRFIAIGRDIYGQGSTSREVYSLQAKVIPGNSGGPLVGADGTVLGIVFATSTEYNDVGYALTGHQVAGELAQAERSTTIYSTGSCSE